ncbi:hypothetical protein [Salinibacterium sp. M195]|uniref:hypothetical protein n=1 Tax=Salinibacterium sp. M195 TaxID=2583374 RepID=UPI001C63A65D|nr:hypothetical protein [Salinibacterium sp. M195]QYH36671.1 hypothetical protein FFT87_12345 [Salinibacterium sp. M195]
MTLSQRAINAIARTLPAAARERYREEWRADLSGAAELDMTTASVVWGAAVTSVTIDRDAPEVTGMTLSTLAARRARWALAAFISAGVLGVGLLIWGGYGLPGTTTALSAQLLAAAASLLKIAAIAFVVIGMLATVRAIITQRVASSHAGTATSRKTLLRPTSVTVWVLIAAAVTIGLLMVVPVAIFAIAALATPVVLTIVISGRGRLGSVPIRARTRVLIGVATVIATAATVGLGTLHIVVWNPLAAVPGLSLDDIYAQMAAAGESPFPYLIWVWGAFWLLAALAFGIACVTPKLSRTISVQALAASALAIPGLALSFHAFAGFNMGMSMADTFEIYGGDAALSGPALAMAGQLCLVAAVWLALLPARTNAGRLPEQTTRVVTN